MRSVKKRFKLLLAEIHLAASELLLLSDELSLLEEMHRAAFRVLRACEALQLHASRLSKAEFVEGMAGADSLSLLDDIVDLDVISLLEERFFVRTDSPADSVAVEFRQQLLEKLEKRYVSMIENIQGLAALLESE